MSHEKYVAPSFGLKAFTCPLCEVYSKFDWKTSYLKSLTGKLDDSYIRFAFCSHCEEPTIWFIINDIDKIMVWPRDVSVAPLPNTDMPVDIQKDYNEARSITAISPRGAAALLRLSIQKLCKHLGEGGNDLNTDIGNLVKKGLPVQIQQSLDIVRVTGNNAVHPGEMQLEEDPQIVSLLFQLINLIVENQISQPKAIQEVYRKLPQKAVDAIKKRDRDITP